MSSEDNTATLTATATVDSKDAFKESAKSFIAGGFGGVAAVLVGQPFDTIKVRLQTTNLYTGMLDCAKKTMAKEGPFALYKGMTAPLVGVTPIFAVSFWAYDLGKKLVRAATPNRTSDELTVYELMFAGAFSAIPTTMVMSPVERVKVVAQAPNSPHKGSWSALKHILNEGGLRSLYRGTAATLIRDTPGSAAYFGAYEATKYLLTPKDGSPIGFYGVLFAGGMAGVGMWAIAIPPDVIKNRIQSAPAGTYSGFFDCAKKLLAKEGPGALFKGLGPALVRAFPANAATFVAVHYSTQVMNKFF